MGLPRASATRQSVVDQSCLPATPKRTSPKAPLILASSLKSVTKRVTPDSYSRAQCTFRAILPARFGVIRDCEHARELVFSMTIREHSHFLKHLLRWRVRVVYMCVICKYRLTAAEAEDLIALLWRALEEHGIASPRLRVHKAGDSLNLSLEFLSEQDAALIREVVSPLSIERSLPEPALTPLRHPARSDPMTRARIVRWRLRAEELRTTAEQFSDPSAQRSLLGAARNYDKLAEDAERLLAGQPFAPGDKTG